MLQQHFPPVQQALHAAWSQSISLLVYLHQLQSVASNLLVTDRAAEKQIEQRRSTQLKQDATQGFN